MFLKFDKKKKKITPIVIRKNKWKLLYSFAVVYRTRENGKLLLSAAALYIQVLR